MKGHELAVAPLQHPGARAVAAAASHAQQVDRVRGDAAARVAAAAIVAASVPSCAFIPPRWQR